MNFEEVEVLIAEVQKRPSLWDHRNKKYHNRVVVDGDWSEVSEITQLPKELAKSRWKNLRDQFRKMLKKVQNINSGQPTSSVVPKWIYFEPLMFLQEILESPMRSDMSVYMEANTDTNISGDFEDQDTKFSPESAPCSPPDSDSVPSRAKRKHSAKRKRNEAASYEKQSFELENQPLMLLKDNKFNDEDDDLNFFKSLTPFFRQLPPIRKLIVRSEIQEILVRELSDLENNVPEETSYDN